MSWRRHDTATSHFVASTDDPELRLHLRAHGDEPGRIPVLFVHGATYASRLYDVPHPGASWLKATALAGFAAYAIDIRGYGKSHSPAMERSGRPYACAAMAGRDIDDAVTWILARHDRSRLHLVGGSWGSITTASYVAGIGGSRIDRLVLYAPIFAKKNDGWLSLLADPHDTARLNPNFGACRLVSEAGTRARWDAEMPEGANWRDEDVFQAMVRASLADDPHSARHDPPAFRAPNGTFVDLFEAFSARPLYDPAAIRAPVLLIRGGADPTSTRADALQLLDRLASRQKHYLEIANGAHFVSAERQAPSVFDAATRFLQDGAPHAR
jgi:pimeloyl-ACP methyl ester carboxylesterase